MDMPMERQQRLNEAADHYMAGDISEEDWRRLKNAYGVNLRRAFLAQAEAAKAGGEKMSTRADAKIENGVIKSTFLGIEDHGILTFWIFVGYPGSTQGFGGVRVTVEHIEGILKALGVSRWEHLAREKIRVLHTNTQIYAIGHFTDTRWFDIEHGLLEQEAD